MSPPPLPQPHPPLPPASLTPAASLIWRWSLCEGASGSCLILWDLWRVKMVPSWVFCVSFLSSFYFWLDASHPLTFRRPAKSFSETRVWRIHLRAALFQAQGSDITNYTGNVPELHHKTAPSRGIAWHESISVIAEITATRDLPLTQLLSTETPFTHRCCNKAFDKLLTILIFFFLFVIVSCSLFLIIVTHSPQACTSGDWHLPVHLQLPRQLTLLLWIFVSHCDSDKDWSKEIIHLLLMQYWSTNFAFTFTRNKNLLHFSACLLWNWGVLNYGMATLQISVFLSAEA